MRGSLGERDAVAVVVNGDGGRVTVGDRPNDVLRSPRRVAAEENAGPRRLHGDLVDGGHAPLVELEADVALDPGKSVFLADGEDDVVAGEENGVDDRGDLLAPFLFPLELFEHHPHEAPFLHDERLGRVVDDDLDQLLLGVSSSPPRL